MSPSNINSAPTLRWHWQLCLFMFLRIVDNYAAFDFRRESPKAVNYSTSLEVENDMLDGGRSIMAAGKREFKYHQAGQQTNSISQNNTERLHSERASEQARKGIDRWNMRDAVHRNQTEATTVPNSALMLKSKHGIALYRNIATTPHREERNSGKRRMVIRALRSSETTQSDFQSGLEVRQHTNNKMESRLIDEHNTTENYTIKDGQDAEPDVDYTAIEHQIEQENAAQLVRKTKQSDEHRNHDELLHSPIENVIFIAAIETNRMSDMTDPPIRMEEETSKMIFDEKSGNNKKDDNSNRPSTMVSRQYVREAKQISSENGVGIPVKSDAPIKDNGDQETAESVKPRWKMETNKRDSGSHDHLQQRIERVKREVEKNVLGNAGQHDDTVTTTSDHEYKPHQPRLENASFRLFMPFHVQSDLTTDVATAATDTDVSKMQFTGTDRRDSRGVTAKTTEQVNEETGGQPRLSPSGETQNRVTLTNDNRGIENFSGDRTKAIDGKSTATMIAQKTIESNKTTALLRYQNLQDSTSLAHHRDASDHSEQEIESHTQSSTYDEVNEAASEKNIISENTEWKHGTEEDDPVNHTASSSRMLDRTITANYDERMTRKSKTKEMNASTLHSVTTEVNAKSEDNNELSTTVKIEENQVTFEKSKNTMKQKAISESDHSRHEYTSRNIEKVNSGASNETRSTGNYFTDSNHPQRFTESPDDDISISTDNAKEAADETSTKETNEIEEMDKTETSDKVPEDYSGNKGFRITAAEKEKIGTFTSLEPEATAEENNSNDDGSKMTGNQINVLVTKKDEQQGTAEKQGTERSEITAYNAYSSSERISEHLKTMERFGSVEGHSNKDDTTKAQESGDVKDTETQFVRTTNGLSEEDANHNSTDKLRATEGEKYETKAISEVQVGISQGARETTEKKTANAPATGNAATASRSDEKISQIGRDRYTTHTEKDEHELSHETAEGLHDLTNAIEYASESLVSVTKVLSPLSTKALPTEKEQSPVSNALSRPIEASENALSVMSIAGAKTDEIRDEVNQSTELRDTSNLGLFLTATSKKTVIFAETIVESNDKDGTGSTTDMTRQNRTMSQTAGSKITPNEDHSIHEKLDAEIYSQRSETTKAPNRLNEGGSTIMANSLTTTVNFLNILNHSGEYLTNTHAYDVQRSPSPSLTAIDEESDDYYSASERHRISEQTKSAEYLYDRTAQEQNTMIKYDVIHNLETSHTQSRVTIEQLGVGSQRETSVDHRSGPLNITSGMQQSPQSFVDHETTEKYKNTGNLKGYTMFSEQSFNSGNPLTADVNALSSEDGPENGATPRSTFLAVEANRTDDEIQKPLTEDISTNSNRDKTEVRTNQQYVFNMNSATHSYGASETHRLADATAITNDQSIKNENNQENDFTMAEKNETNSMEEVSVVSGGEGTRTEISREHDSTMHNVIGTEDGEKYPASYDTFTSNLANSQHGPPIFLVSQAQNKSEPNPSSNESTPSVREESQPANFSIFDESGVYEKTEFTATLGVEEVRTERSQQNNSSMFDITGEKDNSERYPSPNDIAMSEKEGAQPGSFTTGEETGSENRNQMQIISVAGSEQTERTQQGEFTMLDVTRTESNGEKYLSPIDIWISNEEGQGQSFTMAEATGTEEKDGKRSSADDLATSNGERTQPRSFTTADEAGMENGNGVLSTLDAEDARTERNQQGDFTVLDITTTEDNSEKYFSSNEVPFTNGGEQLPSSTMLGLNETEDRSEKHPLATDTTASNEVNQQRNFSMVDVTATDNKSEILVTLGEDVPRSERSRRDDYTVLDATRAEDNGKTSSPSSDALILNGEGSLYTSTVAVVTGTEDKREKRQSVNAITISNGGGQSHLGTVDGSEIDNTTEVSVTLGIEEMRTEGSEEFDFSMRDATGIGDNGERTPSLNDILISNGENTLHGFATVVLTESGDKSKGQYSATDPMTSDGEGIQQGSLTAIDETDINDRNDVSVDSNANGARTEEYQQDDFTALGLFGTGENSGRYSPPYDALTSNAVGASYDFTMNVASGTKNNGTRNPSSDDSATSNGERSQLDNFTKADESGNIRSLQDSTAGHTVASSKETAEDTRSQPNVYFTTNLNYKNIKNEKHSTVDFMFSFNESGSEVDSFTTIGVDVAKESSNEHHVEEDTVASSLTRTSTETVQNDSFITTLTSAVDGHSEIHVETGDALTFSDEVGINSFASAYATFTDGENVRSNATDVTVNTNEERTEDGMKLSDNSSMDAMIEVSNKKDSFLTTSSVMVSSGERIENQAYHPKITTMNSTASPDDTSEGHASANILVTWPEQRTSRLNFLSTKVTAGNSVEKLTHSAVDASIAANDLWSEDGMSENLGMPSVLGTDDENSITVPTNKRGDDIMAIDSFSTEISQKISVTMEDNKPLLTPVPTEISDSNESTKRGENKYGYSVQIAATSISDGTDAVDDSSENAHSGVPLQSSELNGIVQNDFSKFGESTASKSQDRLISDRNPLSTQFITNREATSVSARDKITKSGSEGSIERDISRDSNRPLYGTNNEKTSKISAADTGGMVGWQTAIELTTLLRFNDSDSGIANQRSHHVTQPYEEVRTAPATIAHSTRISHISIGSTNREEKAEASTSSPPDGTSLKQHTTSERIGDNKTDTLQRTFSSESDVTTTVGLTTGNNEHIETEELSTSNRKHTTHTNDSQVTTDTSSSGTTDVLSSNVSEPGDGDDNSHRDLMITTPYGGYFTRSGPDGTPDSVTSESLDVTQQTFSIRYDESLFNDAIRTTVNLKATEREQQTEEATRKNVALKSESSTMTLISVVPDRNDNLFQTSDSTHSYAQNGNNTMQHYQYEHTLTHGEALPDGNYPTNNKKQTLSHTKKINYSARSSNGQSMSSWYSDDSHHLEETKVYANEYSSNKNAASNTNEAHNNVEAKVTSYIPEKTIESEETTQSTEEKGLPSVSNFDLHSQLAIHTGQPTNSSDAFITDAFVGTTTTFRQLSSTLPIPTHSEIETDHALSGYDISESWHSNPSVGQGTASKNIPTTASKQTAYGGDNTETADQVHTATGSSHPTLNTQNDCGKGVQCSQEFSGQISMPSERRTEWEAFDTTKRCQLEGQCNTTKQQNSSSNYESGNTADDVGSSPTVASTQHQKFSQSDEHNKQERASSPSSVGKISSPHHNEIKTSLQINECPHSSDHLTVEVGWLKSSTKGETSPSGYQITEDGHVSFRTYISSRSVNQSPNLGRSTTRYASKTEISGKPSQHEDSESEGTKLPPMPPMGNHSITVAPTEYEARYTPTISHSSPLPYRLLSSAKSTNLERPIWTNVTSSAFTKNVSHLSTTVDLSSKHEIDTNTSFTRWNGVLQTDPLRTISATSGLILCPPPVVSLFHTNLPSPDDGHLVGYQPVGTIIVHVCANNYVFSSSYQPVNVYVCLDDGQWTDNMRGESCQYHSRK